MSIIPFLPEPPESAQHPDLRSVVAILEAVDLYHITLRETVAAHVAGDIPANTFRAAAENAQAMFDAAVNDLWLRYPAYRRAGDLLDAFGLKPERFEELLGNEAPLCKVSTIQQPRRQIAPLPGSISMSTLPTEAPVQHPSDQTLFERAVSFATEALLFEGEAQAMCNAFSSMVIALWARHRDFPSPAALFTALGCDPEPFAALFENEHLHQIATAFGHSGVNSETPPIER